jgi:hypothetical protein
MSDQETKDKIKLPAKPLTRNQKWNVSLAILPWAIITALALVSFGAYVGITWEKNHTSEIQSAKESAVQEAVKASKETE